MAFDRLRVRRNIILFTIQLMSLPIIKRFWRKPHAPCHATQGRGSEITTYLESPPHIAYSLYNFLGAAAIIMGSLLMSLPIIKRFWRNVLAPCLVRQGKGITINHIFGIPDPILPIHFATFRKLR